MKKYLGKLFKYGSKYVTKIWKASKKIFTTPAAKSRATWFWRAISIADLSVWGWDMISDDDEDAQSHLQKMIVDQILNEPVLVLLHSEDIEDINAVRYAYTLGGMQLMALPDQIDIMRGQALVLGARYHEETNSCRTFKFSSLDELGTNADMVANEIEGKGTFASMLGTSSRTTYATMGGPVKTEEEEAAEESFSLKSLLGDLAEASELDPVIHRNLDFLIWYFRTLSIENPGLDTLER